jgi:hypothetical protein
MNFEKQKQEIINAIREIDGIRRLPDCVRRQSAVVASVLVNGEKIVTSIVGGYIYLLIQHSAAIGTAIMTRMVRYDQTLHRLSLVRYGGLCQ